MHQSKYVAVFLTCIIMTLFTYQYLYRHVQMINKKQCQTKKRIQNRANAFILTTECNSDRYHSTVQTLENHFPSFFKFYCYPIISINDSHIHPASSLSYKQKSAILVSTIQIWTYEIMKRSADEFEWSFLFEDSIVIHNLQTSSSDSYGSNYIKILQELMTNVQVREKDGFFLLGSCESTFDEVEQGVMSSYIFQGTHLMHIKGYGFCHHASAITRKRAKLFWTEISLYRSTMFEPSIDNYIQQFCIRNQSKFYIVAANKRHQTNVQFSGLIFKD